MWMLNSVQELTFARNDESVAIGGKSYLTRFTE